MENNGAVTFVSPLPPANPTPFVTAGPGRFAQTRSPIDLRTVTIPGGATEIANFVQAVEAMAARARNTFGALGIKWELWNEIEGPGMYSDVQSSLGPYATVSQAIKRIDPGAVILSPSARDDDTAFLVGNFMGFSDGALGRAGSWVDAIAFHFYGTDDPWTYKRTYDEYKPQQARFGFSLPIYVTESGMLIPTENQALKLAPPADLCRIGRQDTDRLCDRRRRGHRPVRSRVERGCASRRRQDDQLARQERERQRHRDGGRRGHHILTAWRHGKSGVPAAMFGPEQTRLSKRIILASMREAGRDRGGFFCGWRAALVS